LFLVMVGRNVAEQRELFPDEAGETGVSPDRPRHPDLPGQTFFA
jgi:hypothetical protein